MRTAPALVAGTITTAISNKQQGNVVTLNPETLILRAVEANVPIEALERLLAMRAELKQELAREAFHRALSEFQANIPAIKKTKTAYIQSTRTGKQHIYHYADIADIQQAIAPKMYECGLSATSKPPHG